MKNRFRKFAVAGVAAAMLATAVPGSAQATHQIGHFIAGAAVGAIIGGALAPRPYYAAPPGPAYAPAPVYVAPRVCWRKEKYFDPYSGWGWRSVQYYC